MPIPDLEPATDQLADLIRNIDPVRFDQPTPCADYRLGDLVDHIGGFALAFTAAARKDLRAPDEAVPQPDVARLAPDWQVHIPSDLATLADAWRDPDAWDGMTRVAGIDLPAETAGLFALDEVVIHGWDLARASGQPFTCAPELLEPLHGLVAQVAGQGAPNNGLFGPAVPVGDEASLFDRILGLTGRDPNWSI